MTVVVRRARAAAGAALLVPQHVRGRGRQRGAVALQVVRQGGVQPLAPLPLAHGAALALPLLPRHLQPHRHAALALAAQARRAAAQTLSIRPAQTPPTPTVQLVPSEPHKISAECLCFLLNVSSP